MSIASSVFKWIAKEVPELADDAARAIARQFEDKEFNAATKKAAVTEARKQAPRPLAVKSTAAPAPKATAPKKSFAVPRGADWSLKRKPARTTPPDREIVTPAASGWDPRIEDRAGEAAKLPSLSVEVTRNAPVVQAGDPLASLFEHEGRGVLSSMSDLSGAGTNIHAINDVELGEPVATLGGQGYMLYTPDQVWAMDEASARRHQELAQALRKETGKDPIFAPWLMGLTSIDFSHMPRETMLKYGMANMNAAGRQRLTDVVRHFVPEFRDVSDPDSMLAFQRASGKARFGLNTALDRFRDAGGLGLGAARLATSDADLLGSRLTGLHNIGLIDSNAPLAVSSHPSYNTGLPGQGIGTLSDKERRLGMLAMFPDLMNEYNMLDPYDFPVGVVPGVRSPLRSMQMGPKGTILTDNTLRRLEQLIDRRNWYEGAED